MIKTAMLIAILFVIYTMKTSSVYVLDAENFVAREQSYQGSHTPKNTNEPGSYWTQQIAPVPTSNSVFRHITPKDLPQNTPRKNPFGKLSALTPSVAPLEITRTTPNNTTQLLLPLSAVQTNEKNNTVTVNLPFLKVVPTGSSVAITVPVLSGSVQLQAGTQDVKQYPTSIKVTLPAVHVTPSARSNFVTLHLPRVDGFQSPDNDPLERTYDLDNSGPQTPNYCY